MSRARLASLGSGLLAVALLAGLVGIGWKWYDSRLPGRYNPMELAIADYGGGPSLSHEGMAGRSVDQLRLKGAPRPDFTKTLVAMKARVRLRSGRTVDALTFNGQVPGPEIRVHQGDVVAITLVNKDLDDGVAIHWHGIDVPNGEDGVPGLTQNALYPGDRYTYRFRVKQRGTFWYHSHQDANAEVRRGLYGAFVILARRGARGAVDVAEVAHTFAGKVALGSNDETERRTVQAGAPVRVRLVNSDSSERRFRLAGAPFRVVAIDGGDINEPTPVRERDIEIGAGARYDLEFTMPSAPVKLEVAGSEAAILFSPPQGGPEPVGRPGPVFDPAGYGTQAPTPFNTASHFDRSFRFKIGRKLGFVDGKPGTHWSINGKLYPHVPMYVLERGELIRITIENDTGAAHPMHLHGQHFLVLSREGVAASGSPLWLDTLNVRAHERYDVGFRARSSGIWMFHCHNLGHAADGLTTHVVYDGVTTPYRAGDAAGNHPE